MQKIRKVIGRPAKYFINRFKNFNSKEYWEKNYKKGGNSGAGSYGHFAEFKAEIINDFVQCNNISNVIEFGCGDGNQLSLFNFKKYIGFDVSPTILKHTITKFQNDFSKSFFLYEPFCFIDTHRFFKADLCISLDVVFHLIEQDVFEKYLKNLFDCSTKYVIIYSSNTNKQAKIQAKHVYHRKFTDWIQLNVPNWKLIEFIPNKYPLVNNEIGTYADFYIYKAM